ncbi:hypothetical protein Tco_1242996 [Tanacetum coccineum]
MDMCILHLSEGPILEDVEETIVREEVDLGISPPNTELDEGEFEDLDIEHVFERFNGLSITGDGNAEARHT